MKRREAITKTTFILKSALLAPGILGALNACKESTSSTRGLKVLTDLQDDLVKAIADTIIPKTKTPSASEVEVNFFIDLLLDGVFEKEVREGFIAGLKEFDEECQSVTKSPFTKLSKEKRFKYLNQVDQEVMGKEYHDLVPFYYTFKVLALKAYFSSKEGVTQNLDHNPIPGYQADVECNDATKIMVGNHM